MPVSILRSLFHQGDIADRVAERDALIECRSVFFKICGNITDVQTFAVGRGIRELPGLRKLYGRGRWRKRKGVADVELHDGTIRRVGLHWYEASGIGKKEFKIKRFVD